MFKTNDLIQAGQPGCQVDLQQFLSNMKQILSHTDVQSSRDHLLIFGQQLKSAIESLQFINNNFIETMKDAKQAAEFISNMAIDGNAALSNFETISADLANAINVLENIEAVSESFQSKFMFLSSVTQEMVSAFNSITNSTTAITNIARRSNLLALNAAIEAARAGEYGRGFSVVAEEVRQLSKSSKDAAEYITDSIQEVNKKLDGFQNIVSETTQQNTKILSEFNKFKVLLEQNFNDITHSNNIYKGIIENSLLEGQRLDSVITDVGTISNDINQDVNEMGRLLQGFSKLNNSLIGLENNYSELSDQVLIAELDIKKTSKLVLGHALNYKPWAYIENGKSTGIGIDIINRLNLPIEFVSRSWLKVLELFENDVLDGVVNVGWPNDQFYQRGYWASKPYTQFKCVVFSYIEDPDAPIAGKKVGVVKGAIGESNSILKKNNAVIVEFDSDKESFNALNIGDINYVYSEREVGRYITRTFFNDKFRISSRIYEAIDVVVLVKKHRTDIIEMFNARL